MSYENSPSSERLHELLQSPEFRAQLHERVLAAEAARERLELLRSVSREDLEKMITR